MVILVTFLGDIKHKEAKVKKRIKWSYLQGKNSPTSKAIKMKSKNTFQSAMNYCFD